MKILTILLFMCSFAAHSFGQSYQECRDYLIKHEGYRNTPYFDHLGTPHVGIGHLLTPYERFRIYADWEIEALFARDLATARADAHYLFPNFDSHPHHVKIVLIDLCFNLGRNRLSKFKNFRLAIDRRMYELAAYELLDSKYAKQVPKRAMNNHRMLRGLPNNAKTTR
jgi:lysozyme